jgi:hypothetical protein
MSASNLSRTDMHYSEGSKCEIVAGNVTILMLMYITLKMTPGFTKRKADNLTAICEPIV